MTDTHAMDEQPRDANNEREAGFGLARLRRLAEARNGTEEQDFGEYDPAYDDWAPEPAPTIYPADPGYCVTVYYDPSVINTDAAFNELYVRMVHEYGGRPIDMRKLDKAAFNYERLSPYPGTEARFVSRGYVADVEGRFLEHGGPKQTRFARRNVAALTVNAMMMSILLHKHPIDPLSRRLKGQERWRAVWKMMAPVMGKPTLHRNERDALVMAQARGNVAAAIDVEGQIYPLVEHEGLLLGTRALRKPRTIHWAYEITPLSAWRAGEGKNECDALFGCSAGDINDQVRFEAKNIRQIFRPELLGGEAAPIEVTPMSIATWYSQALATIRKVCWLVTTEEEPALAAHALHQEAARHDFALGGPERLPNNAQSWDELLTDLTRERTLLMGEQMPPVAVDQTMTYRIRPDEEILAGLMGTTYDSHDDPGESPYSNPLIFEASLARWIGRLKRARRATLDAWTAASILSFWRQAQGHDTLLLSQFPLMTWRRLVNLAEAMKADREMPDVEVTYAWTRDQVQPYKCTYRDNVLALEGPLLCFPLLRASYWQEKANIINRLGGFELKQLRNP